MCGISSNHKTNSAKTFKTHNGWTLNVHIHVPHMADYIKYTINKIIKNINTQTNLQQNKYLRFTTMKTKNLVYKNMNKRELHKTFLYLK